MITSQEILEEKRAQRRAFITPDKLVQAIILGRKRFTTGINIGIKLHKAAKRVTDDKNLDGVSTLIRIALLNMPEIEQAIKDIEQEENVKQGGIN